MANIHIHIPQGYPLYAFVPEWFVYSFWVGMFVAYLLVLKGFINVRISSSR